MEKNFTGRSVLVWITNPAACQRIVEAGQKLANELSTDLDIVSIQGQPAGNWEKQAKDLELLHRAARNVGAELTVVYSDNAFKAATEIVDKIDPQAMITGLPGTQGRSAFLDYIFGLKDDVQPYLVDASGNVIRADIQE